MRNNGGRTARVAGGALSFLLTLSVILFALQGCSGTGGESPGDVAGRFLDALIAGDAAETYALLSESSKAEMGATSIVWPGILASIPVRPERHSLSVRSL